MERSDRASALWWLGAMMLLVVALSYFFFLGQSLRLDEAQSLWESGRSPADIVTIVSQDVHVPLYHEVLHFWRLIVGSGVERARLLSLLFYLLAIPAVYLLGLRAYGRRVGLFAALLLTLSPFMNWYGNEIRMYTLLTLVVLINQYFFVTLFTKGRLAYGSDSYRAVWIGYALSAAVGAFVHYFFFFNLLGQAVFYFLRRDLFAPGALRNFMLCALLIAAVFAPWAWYVFAQGQASFQAPLLQTPSTVNLFSTFSQFLFGFQSDAVNTVFLSLWPISIIFALMTLKRDTRLSPTTQYFLVAVLLPVCAAFFVSFVVPIFESRYLIFTIPALYLLLGSLFENYAYNRARAVRVALAGLMAVMLMLEVLSPQTPVKENYRAAADFLAQRSTPQDAILLAAPFTVYPVEYYYRGASPIGTLPQWNQYTYGPIPPYTPAQLPAQIAQETQGYQDVWLLLSYDQGYNSDIKKYFDSHYQRELSANFSPGLDLYEYKLRYDTPTATHATTSSATAYAQ